MGRGVLGAPGVWNLPQRGVSSFLSLAFDLDLLIPRSPLRYFAAAGSNRAKVL